MEQTSIENIQAAVLIGNACFAACNADAEVIYYAIAIRTGHVIGLSREPIIGTAIEREVRRRVWWTLYMIDRWGSAGLALPRQLFTDSRNAPALPMDEVAFGKLSEKSDPDHPTLAEQTPGLWAHMVNLVRIFGPIQDLNASLVQDNVRHIDLQSMHGSEISTSFLADQLQSFQDQLPTSMKCTYENLVEHAKLDQGSTFVALHLGYHHYATLLYYQYLESQRTRQTMGQHSNSAEEDEIWNRNVRYAQRCKMHAQEFSDLLRASNTVPKCEAYYNIVGHMTVVSSSVLLHTLLFGSEEELVAARQRLEYNFEVLIKLRTFWNSIGPMVSFLLFLTLHRGRRHRAYNG